MMVVLSEHALWFTDLLTNMADVRTFQSETTDQFKVKNV
jgi:hypothetical protein